VNDCEEKRAIPTAFDLFFYAGKGAFYLHNVHKEWMERGMNRKNGLFYQFIDKKPVKKGFCEAL